MGKLSATISQYVLVACWVKGGRLHPDEAMPTNWLVTFVHAALVRREASWRIMEASKAKVAKLRQDKARFFIQSERDRWSSLGLVDSDFLNAKHIAQKDTDLQLSIRDKQDLEYGVFVSRHPMVPYEKPVPTPANIMK